MTRFADSLTLPTTHADWLGLALFLPVGLAIGILYFGSLWWNVAQLLASRHRAFIVTLTVLRILLLIALLAWTTTQGVYPLLLEVAGLLIGKLLTVSLARRQPIGPDA